MDTNENTSKLNTNPPEAQPALPENATHLPEEPVAAQEASATEDTASFAGVPEEQLSMFLQAIEVPEQEIPVPPVPEKEVPAPPVPKPAVVKSNGVLNLDDPQTIAFVSKAKNIMFVAIGVLAVLIIVLFATGRSSITTREAEGALAPVTDLVEQQTEAPTTAPPTDTELLLQEAELLAAGYDYDAAIALIEGYGDYFNSSALLDAITDFEAKKAALVRYGDVTTIPHVFFHSLIVDNARAFDGDAMHDGYNLYMTTVYEFEHILQSMYDRGYVLVDIHDMAYEATDEEGNTVFRAGDIMLPEGKLPFVMSQDDVNYYEYMTDGDKDHVADAKGDGFATRIVIGADGYPTCEYITADGQTVTGDYDIVPILEKFIQAHPDFSYHGARAMLGVTGYEGVLGYRTELDWKEYLGEEAYLQEIEDAKAVVACLKEHGWTIVSHSFGHPHYGSLSVDSLNRDVQNWETKVQPIVGDTDVLLYPYGDDIAGIEAYSGEKYNILYDAGYRYFCNVDSADYWVQIHDKYVRQGRRNLDGYRLYHSPDLLDDLFVASEVIDPERPTPVPDI